MLTRFSFDLIWWPCIWPHMTHNQIYLNTMETNLLVLNDWAKTVVSSVLTRLSSHLTWWCSFLPFIAYIQIMTNILSEFQIWLTFSLLENQQDFFQSDLVTLFLTQHDPYWNLTYRLSRQTFKIDFRRFGLKLSTNDLIFHLTWHID